MLSSKEILDGNGAAAYVSYAFTDVAAIYPITPSSAMAEAIDEFAVKGKKNLFGKSVTVSQMQSEAGVAGAIHGALSSGALATTYTSSQGLLLMIPNMYKMAGELLPCVIHVSSRTVSTHALSIMGDHSDVYACRQTGFAMLCSNNPQEVMDLSAVAHLSAIKGRVPFLHFFDGFRTSHELQKVSTWDYSDLGEMLDWNSVDNFRKNALTPEHPIIRGTAQDGDVFFQVRESANRFYDELPNIVLHYMQEVNKRTRANYRPFNYYGSDRAERIIVAMGSVCDTIEETVDYLVSKGEKVGLVKVRLYRPFVAELFLESLPKTVRKISVLDRTKEPGSIGEPLYLDVLAAVSGNMVGVSVYSGRYGLSSKDTTPGQIAAVYENMISEEPKKRFTIGIEDDVTYLSLNYDEKLDTTPKGTKSFKFWGLGSDGTVGACKSSAKIIGKETNLFVQAYFAHDSKKSGGVTVSHLRVGESPIKSSYYVTKADLVACHNPSYIDKYDMISDLKPGGVFLLNCPWQDEELTDRLPSSVKRYMALNSIKLFTVNALKIAQEVGLDNRINTCMQAAFFKITDIIPLQNISKCLKATVKDVYKHKGEDTVKMNLEAIDKGLEQVHEVRVPESWGNAPEYDSYESPTSSDSELSKYINGILKPVNSRKGDKLPVSAFCDYVDGSVPLGSSAYEKRGIATRVPEWNPENCIQCNFCSYVCPHAVIRPAVMDKQEVQNAPEGMEYVDMVGVKNLSFAVTVSVLDCTGCGNCAQVCPGKRGQKALTMSPIATQRGKQKYFDYGQSLSEKPEVSEKFKKTTVKGSQFQKPLLEFSGACAGCGETPYAKLATQLFGDRMYIANATGCSSIWGASFPSIPYTVSKNGKGPAWQNSLFEDNAEFGYGIALAQNYARKGLAKQVEDLKNLTFDQNVKTVCQNYLESFDKGAQNGIATSELVQKLAEIKNSGDSTSQIAQQILNEKENLSKKSIWIWGGDGWAYDIGFGGLDHVLASKEDINILVFDTEVYSNTGGQASKATPLGATAKFSCFGKGTKKKDLASIAMTYKSVYVAQVAMGANYNQCIKAFFEAESYSGPSLIIAYCPCINHGIKLGMGFSQLEEKRAVESGYWHLFRFDPRNIGTKLGAFSLDSKAPIKEYQEFISGELRYSSLPKKFPDRARELFEQAQNLAEDKYKTLLGELDNPQE